MSKRPYMPGDNPVRDECERQISRAYEQGYQAGYLGKGNYSRPWGIDAGTVIQNEYDRGYLAGENDRKGKGHP